MTAPTTVLVAGATGFVGSRLVPRLVEQGFTVRGMTRNPDRYRGGDEGVVRGDLDDPATLPDALAGVDVAIYLVHALDQPDFERRDAAAARAFAAAAAQAGVRQIVYLGGLGADTERLSPHLRSRREVEEILGEVGVPVTVLRAAIVVGAGGLSWELTRQRCGSHSTRTGADCQPNSNGSANSMASDHVAWVRTGTRTPLAARARRTSAKASSRCPSRRWLPRTPRWWPVPDAEEWPRRRRDGRRALRRPRSLTGGTVHTANAGVPGLDARRLATSTESPSGEGARSTSWRHGEPPIPVREEGSACQMTASS
jgi:uncharacterized protein YbjT (DUF2867 family)